MSTSPVFYGLSALIFCAAVCEPLFAEDGVAKSEASAASPPSDAYDASIVRVMDIRLALGAGAGPKRVHDEYTAGAGSMNPTGEVVYSLDRNSSGFLQLEFVTGKIYPAGGLLWGIGLRSTGSSLDVSNGSAIGETQKLKYNTSGIIAHIDYGYAATPTWHSEAGPFVSVGGASAEWFDQDATGKYRTDTASGSFAQAGLRLGTYWCLVRHLVLGLEGEYSVTTARMKVDHSASGGSSDLTIHSHGFGLGFEVGYRF